MTATVVIKCDTEAFGKDCLLEGGRNQALMGEIARILIDLGG